VNRLPLNEISRKVFHISSCLVPLSYLWFIQEKDIMVILLSIASLFAISIELLRRNIETVKYFFDHWFGSMLRVSESKGSLTGATWLLFGWTITVFSFDMAIAVSALIFLAIGDSFAAIIGKLFPLGRIGDKTLTGGLAGFIVSFGAVMLTIHTLPPIILFLGALAAMLIELLPLKINDNLTIPIFSGMVMMMAERII
tara:strand:- start:1100 stop:1693 length:594 start_codon:yes stop_codon:yes gene_type:complete